MSEPAKDVRSGAAVYNKFVLRIYDVLVVHLSNTYVWRCHRDRIIELYDENLGARHCDIGPGTGWYLAHAQKTPDATVTLLDINTNSLASASARLAERAPRTVASDVLEPLPDGIGPFDSIGANYVFHCVPGSWADKGLAIGHLAARLASDGVLFGGTVLGRGVRHNVAGRKLMSIYNKKGIFHNSDDDAEGLERVLRQHFADVSVTIVGTVALFRASGPS